MKLCTVTTAASSLFFALLVSSTAPAHAQVSSDTPMRPVSDIELIGTPILRPLCLRPFSKSGTFQILAGYSGAGPSITVPNTGGYLEIRRVQARLHSPGLWAADLGTWTNGRHGWYDLRVEGGVANYSKSVDGAIYTNAGGVVNLVLYRNQGTSQLGTGDYEISGCMVDRIPAPRLLPDPRAPHLPRELPTLPGPVEKIGVVPQQQSRLGG
jgi:hypothetical protein